MTDSLTGDLPETQFLTVLSVTFRNCDIGVCQFLPQIRVPSFFSCAMDILTSVVGMAILGYFFLVSQGVFRQPHPRPLISCSPLLFHVIVFPRIVTDPTNPVLLDLSFNLDLVAGFIAFAVGAFHLTPLELGRLTLS